MLEFVVLFWALGWDAVLGGDSMSEAAKVIRSQNQMYVQKECSFTRYPSTCVQTTMGLGLGYHGDRHVDMMLGLANKTISETMLATSELGKFNSQIKLGAEFEDHESQRSAHFVKGSSHAQLIVVWYVRTFIDKCYLVSL